MSTGFKNHGKTFFFDMYFLLLISDKEVMASSLPLRSIVFGPPWSPGEGSKLTHSGLREKLFRTKNYVP
jgi:hypothetical protein